MRNLPPEVAVSKVSSPEVKYMTKAPTSATTDPTNRYRVSFMAAYSRVTFHPQTAISRNMGNNAIS